MADRPMPWRLGDLLALYAGVTVGGVCLLVAWWGSSGTAVQSTQYAWTDLGIAGAVIVASANGLWLLTGRRALGERRRHVLAGLEARFVSADVVVATDTTGAPAALPVTAPGMARYHRPDCQLVAGKAIAGAEPAAHERNGLRPCGVCRP